MQVTGKIKLINAEQTFGNNGFRKRELVVVTDEQYPQSILIEFIQDKCDLLNQFAVNQDVTVYINLRGREWVNPQGETKYFNSIQGWRIEAVAGNQMGGNQAPPNPQTMESPATEVSQEEDDLPF